MWQTGRRLAAAHGNLTPAHADGCAAQCFEGVQRGSIIIPNSESWPPCCHARLQTGLLARLSSYLDGSWRAVCRLVRFGTLSVCLCSAERVVKVHISGCVSAGKGSYPWDRGLSSQMHGDTAAEVWKGVNTFLSSRCIHTVRITLNSIIFVISFVRILHSFSSSMQRCSTPFSS